MHDRVRGTRDATLPLHGVWTEEHKEVREGFLEEVKVKCKGLWDGGFCVEKFSEKCSLISQAIVEKPPREPLPPRGPLSIGKSQNLSFSLVCSSSFIERIQ